MEVYNETIPYVKKQVEHFITEMEATQSALLAQGFLEFDANRLASVLDSIKNTIMSEKPVDRPETHPHPVGPSVQ